MNFKSPINLFFLEQSMKTNKKTHLQSPVPPWFNFQKLEKAVQILQVVLSVK